MIKKTLLIMGYIVMILTILVVLLGGFSVLTGLYQNQRAKDSIKEEAFIKEQFYNNVEKICFEYALGKNKILVQKFDKFLEDNHISKERLLDYIKRLEKYNSIKYEDYLTEKKLLEDSFNKNEISEETFETNQKFLLEKYEDSKNSLRDYFTSKEKMIFENAKEEIDELLKLI